MNSSAKKGAAGMTGMSGVSSAGSARKGKGGGKCNSSRKGGKSPRSGKSPRTGTTAGTASSRSGLTLSRPREAAEMDVLNCSKQQVDALNESMRKHSPRRHSPNTVQRRQQYSDDQQAPYPIASSPTLKKLEYLNLIQNVLRNPKRLVGEVQNKLKNHLPFNHNTGTGTVSPSQAQQLVQHSSPYKHWNFPAFTRDTLTVVRDLENELLICKDQLRKERFRNETLEILLDKKDKSSLRDLEYFQEDQQRALYDQQKRMDLERSLGELLRIAEQMDVSRQLVLRQLSCKVSGDSEGLTGNLQNSGLSSSVMGSSRRSRSQGSKGSKGPLGSRDVNEDLKLLLEYLDAGALTFKFFSNSSTGGGVFLHNKNLQREVKRTYVTGIKFIKVVSELVEKVNFLGKKLSSKEGKRLVKTQDMGEGSRPFWTGDLSVMNELILKTGGLMHTFYPLLASLSRQGQLAFAERKKREHPNDNLRRKAAMKGEGKGKKDVIRNSDWRTQIAELNDRVFNLMEEEKKENNLRLADGTYIYPPLGNDSVSQTGSKNSTRGGMDSTRGATTKSTHHSSKQSVLSTDALINAAEIRKSSPRHGSPPRSTSPRAPSPCGAGRFGHTGNSPVVLLSRSNSPTFYEFQAQQIRLASRPYGPSSKNTMNNSSSAVNRNTRGKSQLSTAMDLVSFSNATAGGLAAAVVNNVNNPSVVDKNALGFYPTQGISLNEDVPRGMKEGVSKDYQKSMANAIVYGSGGKPNVPCAIPATHTDSLVAGSLASGVSHRIETPVNLLAAQLGGNQNDGVQTNGVQTNGVSCSNGVNSETGRSLSQSQKKNALDESYASLSAQSSGPKLPTALTHDKAVNILYPLPNSPSGGSPSSPNSKLLAFSSYNGGKHNSGILRNHSVRSFLNTSYNEYLSPGARARAQKRMASGASYSPTVHPVLFFDVMFMKSPSI